MKLQKACLVVSVFFGGSSRRGPYPICLHNRVCKEEDPKGILKAMPGGLSKEVLERIIGEVSRKGIPEEMFERVPRGIPEVFLEGFLKGFSRISERISEETFEGS